MARGSSGSRPPARNGGSESSFERYVSRGSNRAFIVVVLFLAVALVFFLRLVFLQVIVADEYSAQASQLRTTGLTMEPRRGTIYDRNGHILAISVEATTVYANPSEVTEPNSTARSIAEVLGGTASDYTESLSESTSPTFAYVARKVDVDKAEKLKELELPGIYFLNDTRREYPYGRVGGQVVGACSIEVDEEENREYYVGICGLEMFYNTILAGTPGYSEAEIGADGTPIPGGVHEQTPVVDGQDIIVSIDIEFQEELEKDLKTGLDRVGVKKGTAVVVDASTGEIYAASSSPFFNPADRSVVEEGSMQLKAATNLFEPGSIFKTVAATSILEEGTMTPDTVVNCPPYLEADGYIVSDAWSRGEEDMSLREIIQNSSNVGISLSVEDHLGFRKFYDAIVRYRFNKLTGVDYPGEQLGYLLDFDYWSRVQGYNATFGQGLSVNAFQMLAFYGALENDGLACTPHFLLRKPQTNETPTWESYQLIENTNAIEPMRSMLRSVVTDGTATDADIDGYEFAGKTSTGEIYDEKNGGYRVDAYTIAFCGFINNSTSNFVCFCVADDVPGDRKVTLMFRDIMQHAIDRYNIVAL